MLLGLYCSPGATTRCEWLQEVLRVAPMVTIYGYGAPASDAEAIKLLIEGWGDPKDRNMEQVEMINTLSGDELYRTWNPFIHSDHYQPPSGRRSFVSGRRGCCASLRSRDMCWIGNGWRMGRFWGRIILNDCWKRFGKSGSASGDSTRKSRISMPRAWITTRMRRPPGSFLRRCRTSCILQSMETRRRN